MSDKIDTGWTAETIFAFIHQHRDELRAMGITKIGLFGSYVRGEQTPDSDIDFLFTMDQWTWKRWAKVWNFLEDSFGIKVELVPEEDLRPELHRYVFPEVQYVQIV